METSLDSAVFKSRRERLSSFLEEKKIDAFLFGGVSDLYYLTGFHSEGFFGLVSTQGCWFFASALLAEQLRPHVAGCRLLVGKRLGASVELLMGQRRWKTVGFDGEQMVFRLGDALQKKGLKSLSNPLEPLRAVKGEEELSLLRRACWTTAQVVEFMKSRVRVGMTELQMAKAIEAQFQRRGADGVGFDLIAAVGAHTALPHHRPGDARLTKNSPVLFDMGCRVGAYRSDLTRTFYYGKIPPKFRQVYAVVDAAQKAGIARVAPGVTGGQVDAATRGTIRRAGFGRYFIHSTGHGVGIDIHEAPWMRPENPDPLKADMVLTVEPGIYLPGEFGVRIEDTLRVTPQGHEILTRV
jgi:Xaa-Pro aminopeptidase